MCFCKFIQHAIKIIKRFFFSTITMSSFRQICLAPRREKDRERKSHKKLIKQLTHFVFHSSSCIIFVVFNKCSLNSSLDWLLLLLLQQQQREVVLVVAVVRNDWVIIIILKNLLLINKCGFLVMHEGFENKHDRLIVTKLIIFY